jgi:DNA-binding response OmpR family regulator
VVGTRARKQGRHVDGHLTLLHAQAGYVVTAVASGDEAWRALSGAGGPLLAVLDWMMPGLTGIEVCEKVRAAGLRPSPYLIVLTARDEPGDVVRALQAGADDRITKPFEPGELRARLAVGRGSSRFSGSWPTGCTPSRRRWPTSISSS